MDRFKAPEGSLFRGSIFTAGKSSVLKSFEAGLIAISGFILVFPSTEEDLAPVVTLKLRPA